MVDDALPYAITPWRGRLIGFGCAFVAGVIVAFVSPSWLTGAARIVAVYDAAAIVTIAMFWTVTMHGNPDHTECRAALEDPGRNFVLSIVLVSIVTGFVAAVVILGRGPHVSNEFEKSVIYALGILAVVAGWVLIHTVLTFRYAHLFYFDADNDNEADAGLKFPGTKRPSDYDFAYFSFIIGMTFQVSDVEVTTSRVRRLVLFHGLISFAYNTAIVALVVNIASGLFH